MTRPLRVFLCHASQDKPAVRELYQRLKTEDWIDPWLDEEKLSLGQHWTTVIEDALHDADVVIIFLSSHSVKKEGFVQRELNYAWEISLEKPREAIFLIPFRLDDCIIPRYLSARQWGNYFGDKKESTYQVLLRSLKQRHLQKLQIEAIETAEREKVEQEAKAKADSELAEKFAREKEETDRIAKAKAKLQEEDTARREKEAQERAEKIAREQLEREKYVEEFEDKKKKRQTTLSNINPKTIRVTGISIIALMIFILSGNFLIQIFSAQLTPTLTPTFEVVFIETDTPIFTPEVVFIETDTPVFTPTPELGIGSTMLGEDGMTLVFVPAGEFTMGSNSGESDEQPIHQVTLDAYWIDQTEVTNEKYTLCVTTNRCDSPRDTELFLNSGYANHPVVYVSWEDAKKYCEWAGRRLPTEAEWEKAARSTDGNIYPWGNNAPASDLLNYNGEIGETTEVGNYPEGVSIYGAFDMSGNVWEWVNDWYDASYYQNSPSSNPQGLESGQYRVLRGGSWFSDDYNVRSSFRYNFNPAYTGYFVGFRCAKSP